MMALPVVITCKVHKPRYNYEYIFKLRCGQSIRVYRTFCSDGPLGLDWDLEQAKTRVRRSAEFRLRWLGKEADNGGYS